MNILFACGGTGGHINPAIAIAGYIKKLNPNAIISFIGNKTGMEADLIHKAGYDFYPIRVSGFQRKPTLKNIARNIGAVGLAVTSGFEAAKIIKKIDPDVVVGTGGYVSGPVLRKAHKLGYKTAAHEQNAYPGITTKMLSKYVDLVMLAMPEARRFLPEREYVDTGNPVRLSVMSARREKVRRQLNLDERPFILSFGGSLGAKRINEAIADVIAWHWKDAKYYHYHATGRYGIGWMPDLLKEKGVDLSRAPHISIMEYINNMDALLAAADLVICRAGAITISEIEVQGKAAILIPSPNVAENHQYHNAMTLAKRDAAVIIEEKDLNSEKLISEIKKLCDNPAKLMQMGKAASETAILDSNERIYRAIMKLI